MNTATNLSRFWQLPLIASIFPICIWIVNSPYYLDDSFWLNFGLTVDLTVTSTLLYWWFTKRNNLSEITVFPFFVVALLLAELIIPSNQQQVLDILQYIGIGAESFLILYAIRKVSKVRQQYRTIRQQMPGFLESISSTFQDILGRSFFTKILAHEIAVGYYAFWGWSIDQETQKDSKSYTVHQKSGYIALMGVIIGIGIVEIFSMHLLLVRWSMLAAWILSFFSLYGLIFLLADINAMRKRKTYIANDQLHVHIGLRWNVNIPLYLIKDIQIEPTIPSDAPKSLLQAQSIGSPNVLLQLSKTLTADGYYGFQKKFDQISLSIDQLEDFVVDIKKASHDSKWLHAMVFPH
ncbi:MAG: hypothetical protein GY810_05070 [Aureispira sp.]|nr:hypothetical protein [Aureispira sp.]